MLCLLIPVGAALAAQSPPPPALTLEQAISRVQRESGGTILSAERQRRGRKVEYRLKVLTPDGHVRVLAVPADAAADPAAADSTKNPAGSGAGNKEKH